MSPLLLDLYCGGGGAAVGYRRAGFEVVGIDINRQGNYPFRFVQGDALDPSTWLEATDGREPDFIHASPPCQAYTRKAADWGRKRNHWIEHPDLIGPTRELLEASGLPYVIENVPGAPVRHDLMLCGTMFGLAIRKHRYFGKWVFGVHQSEYLAGDYVEVTIGDPVDLAASDAVWPALSMLTGEVEGDD